MNLTRVLAIGIFSFTDAFGTVSRARHSLINLTERFYHNTTLRSRTFFALSLERCALRGSTTTTEPLYLTTATVCRQELF
jgi:hypothetical protein